MAFRVLGGGRGKCSISSFSGLAMLELLTDVPAVGDGLTQAPVLLAGHVEEQWPPPGAVDFSVDENLSLGMGLHYLADEDVVAGIIDDLVEAAFHAHRALGDHRRRTQLTVKDIEE